MVTVALRTSVEVTDNTGVAMYSAAFKVSDSHGTFHVYRARFDNLADKALFEAAVSSMSE